jgi:low temperature requirement protein LtrA
MAAMFVLALSIPEAFVDGPGGLDGPIVVALCFFVFRLAHLLMFWLIARDDPGLRNQLIRWVPSVLGGTLLLLAAAELEGRAQTLMWAAALTADYLGTLQAGAEGWRIRSPGHFAERHGLIIIVALGESIVAIGVGVAALPVTTAIVVASCVGLIISAAMWWAYFDMSALHAEHAFAAEPAETQARFARDAYSFLHAPMIAGIVLSALGMKKVLEYVADTSHHDLSDPLPWTAVVALFGGVLAYLVGHVAFKWRTGHAVMPSRVVAAAAILLLALLGGAMPALVSLAVVAAVLVAMVAFETFQYAEHRAELHGW